MTVHSLHVNHELCQGHGLCYFTSPDLVQLDETDGRALVMVAEIELSLLSAAHAVVAGCPERALELRICTMPAGEV